MNEVELVFSELLNCDRFSLCLNKKLPLTKEKGALISSILKRRFFGEPVQYILGKAEFMGLEFKVTPDVLIPRPETEILVESVISIVHSSKFRVQSILDLGTGSGCIAVSLAKFISTAQITATDISQETLAIAKDNAILNKVEDRIKFIRSDLFSNYELCAMNYELIISNPPYIPTEEIDKLQLEVRHEPRAALDGGTDGLDFYRRIIQESPAYLKQGGLLIMEMGFGQHRGIENMLKKSQKFEIINIIKDYNNIDRVIIAKNMNSQLSTLNSQLNHG